MAKQISNRAASSTEDSLPSFPFPPPLDKQWKQVIDFPSADPPPSCDEEEYEWTEEVEYLNFDFGHSHAPSPISSYSSFQVLGLNTAEPYLKIGDQIYRGEYESLVGTELIMRPVSVIENEKNTNRPRLVNGEQAEERAEEGAEEEQTGGENEQREEGVGDEGEEEDAAGGERVKVNYEPLTHTHSRIRWVPVTLAEKGGQSSGPESSSPEGVTGAERKTKKRPGSGAGGRHWASHWTKFTPRASRSKTQVVVQPDQPATSQPQPQPQPQSSQTSQPDDPR